MTTEASYASSHVGTGSTWSECVEAIVAQIPTPPSSTLGFVYWTDALAGASEQILTALREKLGVEQWVGTVGLGVCGNASVHFDEPAISVLILELPKSDFRVFPPVVTTSAELPEATKAWQDEQQSHLALVHADQNSATLDSAIRSLAATGSGLFLLGGIGSSRGDCLQIANQVVSGGVSGTFFSPNVAVVTRLSQGCSPIGPTRTVTAGTRNIIQELDGRRALDVFKEDIGEVLARDLRRVAGYIFAGFQVQGSDTGEYLVRNLTGIDPESGAMAVGELVTPGDKLMFCRRDPQTAVQDMRRMLNDLGKMSDGRTVRAGVYVSCLARGPNQFDPPDLELTLIREQFGDIPVAGFFANGEISNDRLYGYTGVLTLFL